MVPNEVFNLKLKPHEFSVLCYILKCCDKTKTCYPSIMTIANACSISENTARKCVNNLCERNIISKSGGFAVGKFGKIQPAPYIFSLNSDFYDIGFAVTTSLNTTQIMHLTLARNAVPLCKFCATPLHLLHHSPSRFAP